MISFRRIFKIGVGGGATSRMMTPQTILKILIDQVSLAHAACGKELGVIFRPNWEREFLPSVDIEIYADAAVGPGFTLARGEALLDHQHSLDQSWLADDEFFEWAQENHAKYPAFAAYLAAVEHCRAFAKLLSLKAPNSESATTGERTDEE